METDVKEEVVNGKMKDPEINVPVNPAFIGGEVHIIADAATGQISVNAPSNKLIAYGLLKMAEEIIAGQKIPSAPTRPMIMPVGADALSKLKRPS